MYILASHLFDIGVHQLEILQCPTLPPALYKTVALNTQAIW